MNEERNGQAPNDEPTPATPDILEKGEDAEVKEPPSATQDIMQYAEEPPKAKQDVIWKMMTTADLEEAIKEPEQEKEDSDEE